VAQAERAPSAAEVITFLIVRAATYAALFIGFVLVFLPAQVLRWSGISRPAVIGIPQVCGLILGTTGAVLALWCVLALTLAGKGTPAPFDPPRHLVVGGPYRLVRNPMYLGAGLALGAAALLYQSLALLGFAALFLVVAHLFVLWYEEPTLRRLFGSAYDAYCGRTRRWWPGW